MDKNLQISSMVTLIFFILQFMKCKYETTDTKVDLILKSVVKDSILVFSSTLVGLMLYDKFLTQAAAVTPVFTEKPTF